MTNEELSHNVYSDLKTVTLKELPNYLIIAQEPGRGTDGMILYYATNISDAIKIATCDTKIHSIFEIQRTQGRFWQHKCDISKGIF